MAERTRTYATEETIRINLAFESTAELVEGDVVHAVFYQTDSPSGVQRPQIELLSALTIESIVPDKNGIEHRTYRVILQAKVTPDIEPGDYVCEDLFVRDDEGYDWPFTDQDQLDLVIRVEQSYMLVVLSSDFGSDS